MNLIERFSTVNTTELKGREIKYIVIHYTAGVKSSGTSDEATASWFSRITTKASADFIVDDDSVTQFNPDIKNRYTWHCGGSKYNTKGGSLYGKCTNKNSIGIEICSRNDTGKPTTPNDAHWSFSDEAVNNTVELVKKLMKEYNVSADNVVRHYDVTGKPCPGIIGWNQDSGDETDWCSFKDALTEEVPESDKDYKSMYFNLLEDNNKLKLKYDELNNEYSLLALKLSKIKDIVNG